MIYSFQLLPHANIHYQEALRKLGLAELRCLMGSLGIPGEPRTEDIGGCAFLSFETPELDADTFARLSRHSALTLLCRQEGGLLRPLDRPEGAYLPRDLAELLKYKGKTSAVFTRMMINCALSASAFMRAAGPLTVLDPLVGRGTTAFCALEGGMNAVGIDADRADLREATDYFSRYLQYHRLKHQLAQSARTARGVSVPEAVYTLAATREAYQAGDTRTLRLLLADTALADALLGKTPADLLVADLPYGIQHAPQDGRRAETFESLLVRALPAWYRSLKPGGAMALGFNTLTLKREKLLELAAAAGFEPLNDPPYQDFSHFVEQAVTRDVVVAVRR